MPAEPTAEAVAEFRVEAILFDLDGTLVDSTAAVHRSWLKIAELLGHPGEDLVRDMQGIPGRQVLRHRFPELSAERIDELNTFLIDSETADTFDVVPTPGAAELLDRLPRARWAIVTSGPFRLATKRIAAAGLASPDVLVTADDVVTGKPDPTPYLLGAERMRLAPDRCLVIEDAPAGVVSARAAGCPVLGLLTTYPELDTVTIPDLASLSVEVDATSLVVRAFPPKES